MERSQSQAQNLAPKELKADAAQEALQAKINFLRAANKFEPFAVVKRKPLVSLACAFGAGFAIQSLAKLNWINLALPGAMKIGSMLLDRSLSKK